jgi:hypothetical protein
MSADSVAVPKGQRIVGWILSCLILVPFLPSAYMKIAQPPPFLDGWTKSYAAGAARPIGIVELLCVALYFIPPTRVIGAILLVGYLGGAVATHVRADDGKFFAPIIVGIVAWLGLWLREGRLRSLLPITKA